MQDCACGDRAHRAAAGGLTLIGACLRNCCPPLRGSRSFLSTLRAVLRQAGRRAGGGVPSSGRRRRCVGPPLGPRRMAASAGRPTRQALAHPLTPLLADDRQHPERSGRWASPSGGLSPATCRRSSLHFDFRTRDRPYPLERPAYGDELERPAGPSRPSPAGQGSQRPATGAASPLRKLPGRLPKRPGHCWRPACANWTPAM